MCRISLGGAAAVGCWCGCGTQSCAVGASAVKAGAPVGCCASVAARVGEAARGSKRAGCDGRLRLACSASSGVLRHGGVGEAAAWICTGACAGSGGAEVCAAAPGAAGRAPVSAAAAGDGGGAGAAAASAAGSPAAASTAAAVTAAASKGTLPAAADGEVAIAGGTSPSVKGSTS